MNFLNDHDEKQIYLYRGAKGSITVNIHQSKEIAFDFTGVTEIEALFPQDPSIGQSSPVPNYNPYDQYSDSYTNSKPASSPDQPENHQAAVVSKFTLGQIGLVPGQPGTLQIHLSKEQSLNLQLGERLSFELRITMGQDDPLIVQFLDCLNIKNSLFPGVS